MVVSITIQNCYLAYGLEIYKRTNNLSILQSAMGHSTLAVTLGYLRGLEIPALRLEDMPRL